MPTIEVLPITSAASGANWAYTTLPPAHALNAPLAVGTNRGARGRASNYENSAARQRQINSRISELERDNYRDVQIPVPGKGTGSGAAGRTTKGSSTQNVRRILASQKTFVNHLADEEALGPAGAGGGRGRRGGSEDSGADDGEKEPEEEVRMVGKDEMDGGQPLGYARSVSRPSKRPERSFCEICGYWGTYRCGKCGARNCGLECAGIHRETKCNKFYG